MGKTMSAWSLLTLGATLMFPETHKLLIETDFIGLSLDCRRVTLSHNLVLLCRLIQQQSRNGNMRFVEDSNITEEFGQLILILSVVGLGIWLSQSGLLF